MLVRTPRLRSFRFPCAILPELRSSAVQLPSFPGERRVECLFENRRTRIHGRLRSPLPVLHIYACTTADDWEKNPRASFVALETGGSNLAEFKINAISEET
jgi:hypothetical protein